MTKMELANSICLCILGSAIGFALAQFIDEIKLWWHDKIEDAVEKRLKRRKGRK